MFKQILERKNTIKSYLKPILWVESSLFRKASLRREGAPVPRGEMRRPRPAGVPLYKLGCRQQAQGRRPWLQRLAGNYKYNTDRNCYYLHGSTTNCKVASASSDPTRTTVNLPVPVFLLFYLVHESIEAGDAASMFHLEVHDRHHLPAVLLVVVPDQQAQC